MATDPTNPRFRPVNPRQASKNYAAIGAFLNDGGPAFGVRVLDPNAPSAVDRARAAYAAEPADPRAMPMPGPLNWLSSLSPSDLKKAPKGVRNWLAGMVKATVRDPVSMMMPVPKAGIVAKEMARAGRLNEYTKAQAAANSQRMQGVNQFLGEQRSAFELGLEPPPLRSTPVKSYVTRPNGRGVDVIDERVFAPEQITLEQARAAGVHGPEAMPLPPYRFTRQGPRIEIHE